MDWQPPDISVLYLAEKNRSGFSFEVDLGRLQNPSFGRESAVFLFLWYQGSTSEYLLSLKICSKNHSKLVPTSEICTVKQAITDDSSPTT